MTSTTTHRFLNILEQLLERSKKNEVNWRKRDNAYMVVFDSDTRVFVTYDSPSASPDWASAALMVRDNVVSEIHAEDGDPKFDMLKDLFEQAERIVLGWDVAMDSLEQLVKAEGPVGKPQPEPDDIPF